MRTIVLLQKHSCHFLFKIFHLLCFFIFINNVGWRLNQKHYRARSLRFFLQQHSSVSVIRTRLQKKLLDKVQPHVF